MKLSLKKIYSIAMAGIALLLFIFSFIPYAGDVSEWAKMARYIGLGASFSIFKMLIVFCIIATYLLHLFKDIDEKWVKYANYGVGYIVFHYIVYFFNFVGEGTNVGFWFCTILAFYGILQVKNQLKHQKHQLLDMMKKLVNLFTLK